MFFQAGEKIFALGVEDVIGIYDAFLGYVDAEGVLAGEFLKLCLPFAAEYPVEKNFGRVRMRRRRKM